MKIFDGELYEKALEILKLVNPLEYLEYQETSVVFHALKKNVFMKMEHIIIKSFFFSFIYNFDNNGVIFLSHSDNDSGFLSRYFLEIHPIGFYELKEIFREKVSAN